MSVPAEQLPSPVLQRWAEAGASPAALETVQRLMELEAVENLADELEETQLGGLAEQVLRGYQIDKQSRAEWEDNQEAHMKAASQAVEQKDTPWPRAASVKYPLVTVAALQFNARAYPQIVQGNHVAKAVVLGEDKDNQKHERADRVEEYSNYQLLFEMDEWQADTDRLLVALPILGTVFRKTYYSSLMGRNVSDLVLPQDLVINYDAPSLTRAARATHVFPLYPHELESRMRDGTYRRVELGVPYDAGEDEAAPHKILEQHCREDLDGDGYPEPLVITVHEETRKVLRIKARYDEDGLELDSRSGELLRIQPVDYFTQYSFIPNPESAIYAWGFGDLLRSIGSSINTSINQMLDAGHLQNTPFWLYGRGVRMRAGKYRIEPGQGIPVDTGGGSLRDNIYVPQFNGPSPVLFQLLGLLVDAGKDIASIKDVLTGEQPANVPATTTIALIEQGLQVFGAIFKRVHRALGEELSRLYQLNRKFLQPKVYFRVLDTSTPAVVALQDFSDDLDIMPVSDPTVLSQQQRLAKSEALLQFNGDPMIDQVEIRQRYFEAVQLENIGQLFTQQAPPPPPEVLEKQAELELKSRELDIKEQMAPFERMATLAQALERFAKAEAEEAGSQAEAYQTVLEAMRVEIEQARTINEARAARRVEGTPGNPRVPGVPAGLPGTSQ